VFHNTKERKIAELDLSSVQFEDGVGVRHMLQLNKERNPYSMDVSNDLGSLLATLRTYV
jgi:hypothetical protein